RRGGRSGVLGDLPRLPGGAAGLTARPGLFRVVGAPGPGAPAAPPPPVVFRFPRGTGGPGARRRVLDRRPPRSGAALSRTVISVFRAICPKPGKVPPPL